MPPTAYGSRSFTWCLPRPSSCSTASLSASRPKPLAAEMATLVLPARDLVVGDEIALVVAFQYRRAGRCKLRDQTVDDRDVIVALRVGAVDDVDEKIRVFQLFERGAEGLDRWCGSLAMKPTVSDSSAWQVSETVSCRVVVSSVSNRRLLAGMSAPVRRLSSVDLPAFV